MNNPSGDWSNWLPGFDNQSSPGAETDACVSFSAIHCIESQMYKLTGHLPEYSERALATMSGTTSQGNSVGEVFWTISNEGLIPTAHWPELTTFNTQEFYNPLPPDVKAAGKYFLDNWTVQLFQIPESHVTQALQDAPLWIELKYPDTTHFVMQINSHQYFDSYSPAVKELTLPVLGRWQILLTPKGKSVPQIFTQTKGQEKRIVIAAADENQWNVLCAAFGKDPATSDETVS